MRLVIDIRKFVGKIHDEWDGVQDGSFTKHLNKKKSAIEDSLRHTVKMVDSNPSVDVIVKFQMPSREAHLGIKGWDKENYLMLQQLLDEKGVPTTLIGGMGHDEQ